MHTVAKVGNARVAIVHGDAWSLAGWRFAHDMLDDPAQRPAIAALRERTGIDIFASTHTCLAALRQVDTPRGALTVINNGATGMPNIRDTGFGLISRIAVSPSPHSPLYGAAIGGVHVGAIPVRYDRAAFLARFLARWPHGSPAHRSYFARIVKGPDHDLAKAAAATMVAA
jgi:hypothetical protein